MAHGYLTKVPIAAIEPYIQAFTEPGEVVLDPFAGSGMTGVARCRHRTVARLVDVSVLGRHIGTNYVNLVDPAELRGRGRPRHRGPCREALDSIRTNLCSSLRRSAEPQTVTRFVGADAVACAGCGEQFRSSSR